jgi:20S proteasome subunit beta 3
MSDPLSINGSAIVAMAGNKCVAIAADRRFGVQAQTVSMNMQRIFKMNNTTLVGMAGLATDVATVFEEMCKKMQLYKLREDREMKTSTFDNVLSNYLYSRRFSPYFVEPLVAGLEGPDFKPYLSGQDVLGCPVATDDFVVAGTAQNSLYGTCETLFRPNLNPDELFEVISQCLINATDRDCLSGWGGVVYILTPDRLIIRELVTRQD